MRIIANKKDCVMVALDTSTSCTGYAIYNNGRLSKSGVLDLSQDKNLTGRDKTMQMVRMIFELLDKSNPDILIVEKLNVSRNLQTTRELSKIIGSVFVYAIISKNNIFYDEFQANQARKLLGFPSGKRNVLKAYAKEYVFNTYQKKVQEDEADAICLGDGYIEYIK